MGIKLLLRAITFTFMPFLAPAQDTFSIVAVDSVSGEVGSAGASCVDLFQTPFMNDDFLGVLFPGEGAINTQAAYLGLNQSNATNRFNAGDTPAQIIAWLQANDAQGTPETRQYGVVRLVNGSPQSAAHTGTSCFDYKNHNTGPNYSIQGNILLGQMILDSMETYFNNAPGDLACKLMAALEGAKRVGADTRCTTNGTSSLFAFLKVAQPGDSFGNPSLLISVRTQDGAGIEPIDSLRTIFDQVHACPLDLNEPLADEWLSLYPNPVGDRFTLLCPHELLNTAYAIVDQSGRIIRVGRIVKTEESVNCEDLEDGIYYLIPEAASQVLKLVRK